MGQYVALLRGINVGGNNLIKMTALSACFEKHGFQNVVTYIQSGNVIFEAGASAASKLTQRLEAMLAATFSYRASVVLLSRKELQRVVAGAPKGFGAEPARYRYDVLFLKPPLGAAAAMEIMPMKEGVDQLSPGQGVIYFSRLISKASQSRISKIVSMPIYQSMTIRNWNTTTKLVQILNVRATSASTG
jgi:uncharacterized protein (DUF1697 family)